MKKIPTPLFAYFKPHLLLAAQSNVEPTMHSKTKVMAKPRLHFLSTLSNISSYDGSAVKGRTTAVRHCAICDKAAFQS
jgi:hypothetical protein